jgi:putative transposase
LFRPKTKSECITKYEGITPSFYKTRSGTIINTHNLEKEYPYVCFNYIHNNPVAAGLVQSISEWEFSSFPDYYNKRNGNLINRERAKEFGCILI